MYNNRIEKYGERRDRIYGDEQSRNGDGVMQGGKPTLDRIGDAVVQTIRKQPLAGLAVGLAIGVILGCIVKRR
jgi:ElaB/YqjD/DUF883 family membrane-anchored ribosome-binding protein